MERVIQALVGSMEPASLMSRVAEQACVFAHKADGAAVTLSWDPSAARVLDGGTW